MSVSVAREEVREEEEDDVEETAGEIVIVLTETERVAAITKEITSAVIAQMEEDHDHVAMQAKEYIAKWHKW